MQSRIGPALQRNEHPVHQRRIGTTGERVLLRFAHLGRRHHLHRFRDLRSVADRFDPAPDVLCVCHILTNIPFLDANSLASLLETDHCQVALKSFSAVAKSASRSLSISFFSRIERSKLSFRVCEIILELLLKFFYPLDRNRIEKTILHRPKNGHLLLDRNRIVLHLLEEFDDALTAIEPRLGRGVEIGTELRERRQLAELREVELDLSRRPV